MQMTKFYSVKYTTIRGLLHKCVVERYKYLNRKIKQKIF